MNRKVTNSVIVNTRNIIYKLFTKEHAILTTLKLKKFFKCYNDCLTDFEKERFKLLEKYGKLNKDKSKYDLPDKNKEVFNKDITKLLEKEVIINNCDIKLSMLKHEMSVSELEIYEIFFENDLERGTNDGKPTTN